MKKILLSVSIISTTAQGAESLLLPPLPEIQESAPKKVKRPIETPINRIITTFKAMSEEQQIRALINANCLPGWINIKFPEYTDTMNSENYLHIAREIGFKTLVHKVKRYCLLHLPIVLKQYIDQCEKANTRTCQVFVDSNNGLSIIGNDVTKELVAEYLNTDQVLFFYIATSIHNDLEQFIDVL